MKDENLKIVKKITEDLLNKDLNSESKVNVLVSDEGVYRINIESPMAANLIGFHGETLQSIKLILSFLIHGETKEWLKIEANIGDYLEKREEQLTKLALNLAMKAKFSGEVQIVPNLSSQDRRFIHMVLTDNPDVFTESEGEGRNRFLTIKPKNKNNN
jgi:spoIIIJ-associated protein